MTRPMSDDSLATVLITTGLAMPRTGDPRPFLNELSAAMQTGHNVRGALVGRNVLFPAEEDPLVIAEAAGLIVHKGLSVEDALTTASSLRGRNMDFLRLS